MARWASCTAKIAPVLLNTKLLDSLQENSEFLTDLSDQFSNFGKNIPTVCISEGLPTPKLGIVSLLAFVEIVAVLLICKSDRSRGIGPIGRSTNDKNPRYPGKFGKVF